jgi:uncharacterized protein (DUF849 family)
MLPRLMVAPNGARRTKADHPAIPLTLAETVETARACRSAGADGLHLHLRDAEGRHLLDAAAYKEALAEFATSMPGFPVQITTEAGGIYAPDVQRAVALESGGTLVSVSTREMLRDGQDLARGFYETCAERGIALQHILYDRADADVLAAALPEHLFRAEDLQLIFVLGRYSADSNSDPAGLDPFLGWMADKSILPDWAVCAFGPGETASLLRAARHGGKVRVGFENSLYRADGTIARDNAERVADMRELLAEAVEVA